MSDDQRNRAATTLFAVVLGTTACGESESTPSGPRATISDAAAAYVHEVVDTMEAHSINRHTIDWVSFRERTLADAGAAQTPVQTYNAVELAVARLGDGHSFFVPAGGLPPSEDGPPSPSATHLGSGIGYVTVPRFSGSGLAALNMAALYHKLIEGIDTLSVCGWAVDLRGNSGGNMWPMIAGIGPILGDGVAGFFVDPDAVVSTWTHQSGTVRLDGAVMIDVTDAYALISPDPPVALLLDRNTASSGEAVAIAFRGRPDTRSFGLPTRGLSTLRTGFSLSDGALLLLTVSTLADRTGRLYGDVVSADETVVGSVTGDPASDAGLAAAIEWLRLQSPC